MDHPNPLSVNFSVRPELKRKPADIGPGVWFLIHTKAKLATTEPGKQDYQTFLQFIVDNFPCKECQTHAQEFLKLNPLVNFWNLRNNKGDEIGCFKHSWMMHNHANAKTGKKALDFETAYNMYYTGYTVCTSGCGEPHPTPLFAVKSPEITLRPPPRIRSYNA